MIKVITCRISNEINSHTIEIYYIAHDGPLEQCGGVFTSTFFSFVYMRGIF